MILSAKTRKEKGRDGHIETRATYLLHNLLLKQWNLRVHPRNVNVNLRTEHEKHLTDTAQTSTRTICPLAVVKFISSVPSHFLECGHWF